MIGREGRGVKGKLWICVGRKNFGFVRDVLRLKEQVAGTVKNQVAYEADSR